MFICYREINWKNVLYYIIFMYILWYNNILVWGFFLEKDGFEIICNDSNVNCNYKEY